MTAPAAQAVRPGQMLAIMGTSTCHVMNAKTLAEVPGMCGVVDGGIVRGLFGYEAGQSGVGDIFAWFARNLVPGSYVADAERAGRSLHEHLTVLCRTQPVGAHGLLALDWESGNRSVLVDHDLSGLILGMTLATRPEEAYRALIESTAFGTRKIVETFDAHGVPGPWSFQPSSGPDRGISKLAGSCNPDLTDQSDGTACQSAACLRVQTHQPTWHKIWGSVAMLSALPGVPGRFVRQGRRRPPCSSTGELFRLTTTMTLCATWIWYSMTTRLSTVIFFRAKRLHLTIVRELGADPGWSYQRVVTSST